jgi:RNA polymerase sigma-70 factor, ECF subfamily
MASKDGWLKLANIKNGDTAMLALSTPGSLFDDLSIHRDAMLRFARRKVRDADLAEDAVQDALISALASRDSFKGQSALRTWLIGILNHKIQDAFRRESRFVRSEAASTDSDDWIENKAARHNPHEAGALEMNEDPCQTVARSRMHAQLAREIDALPETLKDVFTLQAIEGVETEEVCRRLQISEANCWVRLHRARKRLTERMAEHLA